MKKTSSSEKRDEIRDHYDLDFRRMRSNRFAQRFKDKSVIAVVLDADVADVFQSSEAVNEFLRSAIKAMPRRVSRATATRKRRAS